MRPIDKINFFDNVYISFYLYSNMIVKDKTKLTHQFCHLSHFSQLTLHLYLIFYIQNEIIVYRTETLCYILTIRNSIKIWMGGNRYICAFNSLFLLYCFHNNVTFLAYTFIYFRFATVSLFTPFPVLRFQ